MNAWGSMVELPEFGPLVWNDAKEDAVSLALVGYGNRGEELADAIDRLSGVRLVAVADVWPWRLALAEKRRQARGAACRTYRTIGDLLRAEEARVDAVIVATPDWQHADHVSECLRAGKHVYCEGELANSLEKARELVALARGSGCLVQGGHQRRSNPRYRHAVEVVCRRAQGLGRVTHAYAQWHRGAAPFRAVSPRLSMPTQELEALGYKSMEAFLNWEWFSRTSWGPCAALAGQKLDLMRWFWQAEPSSVTAMGGSDCYGRETPDNLLAMFTFKSCSGEVTRGYIQILNHVSRGGSYEQFMGENAALTIAEVAARGNAVQPEEIRIMLNAEAKKTVWMPLVDKGLILPLRLPPELEDDAKSVVDLRVTKNAPGWPLPVELTLPAVQPHLENFVAAIRGAQRLNDPIGQSYANLVGIEGALRSARERRTIDFKAQDFVA